MDLNRRGWLKLFGAGATVVPLLGGEVIRSAEAKLIEPPQIEPVTAADLTTHRFGMLPHLNDMMGQRAEMVVLYRAGNQEFAFTAKMAIATAYDLQEIGYRFQRQPLFVPRDVRYSWELKGECVADQHGNVFTVTSRDV